MQICCTVFLNIGINNAEFDPDFESNRKVAKTFPEKLAGPRTFEADNKIRSFFNFIADNG
jgi:hypothetical protein